MSKYIGWYDKDLKRVMKYLLYVNCTNKDSVDNTLALKHALEGVWPPELPIKLYGQCTDSGGARTIYSLAPELENLGLCAPNYLVALCFIHNIQTAIGNAAKQVLEVRETNSDGTHIERCMQMLHGAYNIQNWHEIEEVKKLYTFVRETEGLE